MYQTMLVFHVLICLSIIGLVLLQQGRGADAGAGFGGGASSTLFGARGSSSFLSRSTAILAALFFGSGVLLAYLGDKQDNAGRDVMDNPAVEQSQPDLPTPPSDAAAPANGDVPADVPVAPSE